MEALSVLTIPEYIKKQLKKKILGSQIDYKRFNIKSQKALDHVLSIRRGEFAPNTSNSNLSFNNGMTFERLKSPNGYAHKVSVVVQGDNSMPLSVPVLYIEVYHKNKMFQGAVGRLDFYGSYFRFKEMVPEKLRDIENYLDKEAFRTEDEYEYDKKTCRDIVKNPPIKSVRRTRVDVAFDFELKFPQNHGSWITPSKLSNRPVTMMREPRHDNKFAYYAFLAEKNSSYGVRMYDKKIESKKHGKDIWYSGFDKLEHWTRIEFEFYPPYASDFEDFELLRICSSRIIGDSKDIQLGFKYSPPIGFKVENAWDYFNRYAKNHGIELDRLLEEVYDYDQYIKEKMDIYGLSSE